MGPAIEIAETGKIALQKIKDLQPVLIYLDLKLPDMDGITILRKLKAEGNAARVIVITAHGSIAVAVEAMREGATDFLLKPFNAERLTTITRTALELQHLSTLVEQYEEGYKGKQHGKFIGESAAMKAIYRMVKDAAPSRASVFIVGESGTGKELCAEAIHTASPRRDKNFMALNCAAIPENLMESEIFGHVKGAFTGASDDREGTAIRADGGTLFLDEICEMHIDLQAKLLRFIQTGQIIPVGTSTPIHVNVRFICATNRNPWEEVQAGRFREDLYYRLHVIPIHMPPLRDRGEDAIDIARSLLIEFAREEGKQFRDFSENAKTHLLAHHWPGNVRELGNVIQSAVVLNDGEYLTDDMIKKLLGAIHHDHLSSARFSSQNHSGPHSPHPDTRRSGQRENKPSIPSDIKPLAVSERKAIEEAIAACDGSVRKAAKYLDVNASTLYRKIKLWEKTAP